MARPNRLLLPVLAGSLALSLATAAQAAPGDEASPAKASASPKTASPAPEVTSAPSHKVAGTQVEGEASVSTESGFAGSGSASDGSLRGTFGVGAIRTISGLTGINARYFVLDRLSVGLNVGLGTYTYRENDPASTDVCPGPDCRFENTRTIATLGMGLEGLYFIKLGNPAGQLPFRADFGLGGRFTVFQGINDADVPDNHDDPTEFDIEIPMVVQLRFGDHFTLSPEFGLNFIIVPGSREDGDVNPGTGKPDFAIGAGTGGGPYSGPGFGFQITNGIGVFGGASLHYYF